jgi:hypothetical protein
MKAIQYILRWITSIAINLPKVKSTFRFAGTSKGEGIENFSLHEVIYFEKKLKVYIKVYN